MPTPFSPRDLFETLRGIHPADDTANFLVVDVSPDKCALLELSYNDLGMFQRGKIFQLDLPVTLDTIQSNLIPEIEMLCPEVYRHIYLIGEYAKETVVQKIFSQRATHADAHALGLGRMPRKDAIDDYLKRQDGKMPHDLILVMLKMPDVTIRTPRQDEMRVVHEVIISTGTSLRNNYTLAAKDFQTSMLGVEHLFYFAKRNNDQTEREGICFVVIPQTPIFSVVIRFEEGKLKYEWSGVTVVEENPSLGIPHETDTCMVQIDFIAPKVVFLVEAALGLKRRTLSETDAELANITDFDVVRQFIINISINLVGSLSNDSLYNVWFYHDVHPDLKLPHEFNKIEITRPDKIIEKLAPNFIPQSQLENLLRDKEGIGIAKPSLAIDWEKPLEAVAHQLNQEEWGNAGVLLIWIGQSAPHLYRHPVEPDLTTGGILSDYNFDAEIKQLHDKQVTQLALFVNSDLPAGGGIARQARRIWKMIASQPKDIYFHEIRLANADDAKFEANERQVLYNILGDMKSQLQRITTLTFIRIRGHGDMWRLPIKDLEPYTQVQPKD